MRGNRRGSAKQYSNETLRGGNPSALVPAQLKTCQKSPAGVSFSGDTLDDRRGRGPSVPKPNPPGGRFRRFSSPHVENSVEGSLGVQAR
jgi:hypothetical protein